MWKNIVERGRPQMTKWRMRIACCITELYTYTHNMQYLLLSHSNNSCTNAPQCYSYRYIACLVYIYVYDGQN